MNESDEEFLASEDLSADQWRGVQQLKNALDEFVPLAKLARIGERVARQLVSMKLAETGRTSDRYSAVGLNEGYRLTELGWKVADRGRRAKRRNR